MYILLYNVGTNYSGVWDDYIKELWVKNGESRNSGEEGDPGGSNRLGDHPELVRPPNRFGSTLELVWGICHFQKIYCVNF